jgi:hypothetical protein
MRKRGELQGQCNREETARSFSSLPRLRGRVREGVGKGETVR